MAVQGLVEVRTLSESVQAYFLGQNGTSAAFQCTGSSCHIWGATHVDFASSVGCRLCWAILGPRCAMIRILGPFEAADFAI
eukprot:s4176_g4.t1